MKTLILDVSKWRCGDEGKNKLGFGKTRLLNHQGYMCCLGQFTRNLNPDINLLNMMDIADPKDLPKTVPGLSRAPRSAEELHFGICNTKLTENAIQINDSENTTPTEKITLLRKLFGKKGYKIRVINTSKNNLYPPL